jgi:hypothetical protein
VLAISLLTYHESLFNELISLIEKGIMDLFNSLGLIDNVQIQTNVSWIFLALCNNGITG